MRVSGVPLPVMPTSYQLLPSSITVLISPVNGLLHAVPFSINLLIITGKTVISSLMYRVYGCKWLWTALAVNTIIITKLGLIIGRGSPRKTLPSVRQLPVAGPVSDIM